MRKGFLTVLLALAMAFGFAMNAAAIDNLAEPSVGFVVPWVEGDTTGGLDTVIGVYDTPADLLHTGSISNVLPGHAGRRVIWTFFGAATSNHILDNDFPITPGQAVLLSWNTMKANPNLNGIEGYLVFADPFLSTTTLTANALQVLGFDAAAYVPVLQLRGGYFAAGAVLHSLDGWSCADQDLADGAWITYSIANANTPDAAGADRFAYLSGPLTGAGVPVAAGFSPYQYNIKNVTTILVGGVVTPTTTPAPEIRPVGADLQIVTSPNTAYNGIKFGQTVVPRFAGGPGQVLTSFIGIWKPDVATVGAGAVNFWNTATESNISLQFSSTRELVILDPYSNIILGNPNYVEGAVEFRGWPSDGGIVFTLVSAFPGGATLATEIQTLIAPHYFETGDAPASVYTISIGNHNPAL